MPAKTLSSSHNECSTSELAQDDSQAVSNTLIRSRFRVVLLWSVWLVFTGWWISGLVLHYHDKNWIIPFLLWFCITAWAVCCQWPNTILIIWSPVRGAWRRTVLHFLDYIPKQAQIPIAALITLAIIVTVSFASNGSSESTRVDRAISLFGLATFIFVLWATSHNRKKVNWHTVIVGTLLQFVVALFVLRTTVGYDVFNFISGLAKDLLGFAGDGVAFLSSPETEKLSWFLISVIPPIIFFVALIQVLHHCGFIKWFVGKFAVFFWWAMNVSGAEAVAAAACPFIGQGENAVLIKPFLPYLTKAEIHQVMCSGFGTIAGSVLGAYIGLGIDPQALISSCVMSIPASLAYSHLRYPEEEETFTAGRVIIPGDPENRPTNSLDAFARGAWLGLKVAGMVVAVLLSIIAMLGLINGLLTWWGSYLNLKGDDALTVEFVVGYACYPVAFLLGVPRNHELLLVGRLIGTKIVTNEFVAYTMLVSKPEYIALSRRSHIIATYALCGFGNIAALGTQIGVLSQIAPSRSADVSRIAASALLTGVLSTLSSASIAGMLVEA